MFWTCFGNRPSWQVKWHAVDGIPNQKGNIFKCNDVLEAPARIGGHKGSFKVLKRATDILDQVVPMLLSLQKLYEKC